MKYQNPHSDHSGFIDLGEYRVANEVETIHYDLYAIVNSTKSISFGARYGNIDSAYISGNARLDSSGVWELYVHEQAALAAARFFANHCPSKWEN